MYFMFYQCKSIKSIDLSSFITQKVNDMVYMFSFCTSLRYVDVSNFIINEDTDLSDMFIDTSDCRVKINNKIVNYLNNNNLKNINFIK